MEIKALKDTVLLQNREDVLRVHLYFKFIQHNIRPFENDMDIVLELYMFGGYNNAVEQGKFIQICMDKKLKKSTQSIRNTLSKYVSNGVFYKILKVSEQFIPEIKCDKLMLQHIISHAE